MLLLNMSDAVTFMAVLQQFSILHRTTANVLQPLLLFTVLQL